MQSTLKDSPKPSANKRYHNIALVFAGALALLTLLAPHLIGRGESALVVTSLKHWMLGTTDAFAVLHIHWLWIPRILASIIGAEWSLAVTRAVSIVFSMWLFMRWFSARLSPRAGMLAVLLLGSNFYLFFSLREFDLLPEALLILAVCLSLLTSKSEYRREIGALLLGLSISMGVWIFAVILMALGGLLRTEKEESALNEARLFVFAIVGVLCWVMLGLFYFGAANLWPLIWKYDPSIAEVSDVWQVFIFLILSFGLLAFVGLSKGSTKPLSAVWSVICLALLCLFRDQLDLRVAFVILIPVAIYWVLSNGEPKKWKLIVYVAGNLALFLFLPALTNPYQFGVAETRRTQSVDDIKLAQAAPSMFTGIALLASEQAGTDEARLLIASAPDSSVFVMSHSTDGYFDGGTLAALFPNKTFALMVGRPLSRFRINGGVDSIYLKQLFASKHLIGLFDKRLAHEFIDSQLVATSSLHESEHLQMIVTTSAEEQHALIDRMIYVYYRSVAH